MPKDSEPGDVQLRDVQLRDVQPSSDQQLEARIADLENRVNQLTKVQQFSETQLLDALKAANPRDRLDFGDVSRDQMEAAVFKLSEVSGSQAQTAEQREAILVAAGVSAFVGAIIAGVINIWAAFDRGNGVIFFVTWTGIHWFTPR